MNKPYLGGSYEGTADFVTEKNRQVAQYHAKMLEYGQRASRYLALCVLAGILLVVTPFFAAASANAFLLLLAVPAIVGLVIFSRLRRTARKSEILLRQLQDLILTAINDPNLDMAAKKQRVLTIETNFLNNDDELYTKKFIWKGFLQYKHDKGVLYGGTALLAVQNWNFSAAGMYLAPLWVNDGKGGGKWTLQHPLLYILNAVGLQHLAETGMFGTLSIRNTVAKLPPLWMLENPLELDNDDSDFVFINWRIKRRIRDLFFAGNQRTYEVLDDIGEVASQSSVTFERTLRHKKISKKLKEFKSLANLVYLTPAAKMQLIAFVDGVLQDRPYVRQCDSMIDLLAQKNAQIERYTQAFWKVHRRSLKFYVAEALWLALAIPLFVAFLNVWISVGFLAGMGVFVLGGSVIAFGEMAMMTRQIRDMRAKKLTPSLISSLIAIRHNMCAETVNSDERTYEYEQAFKAAEKRFMLTVTEVEAVKLAKENVSDKVIGRLSAPMQNLRQNKEAQAQIYYEKFNHYRRICLKYGALELFAMLLAIPLITAVVFAFLNVGFIFVHLPIALVGLGVIAAIEALALRNHIRVARRKELYLLIYQKMAVLLSNYKLFTDPVYIGTELHKLENSVIRAAEIDNMQDIAEHVSSVAVVDLSGTELANTYQDYQIKQEIGTASQDEAQFQGSLAALQNDFDILGVSEQTKEGKLAARNQANYEIAN